MRLKGEYKRRKFPIYPGSGAVQQRPGGADDCESDKVGYNIKLDIAKVKYSILT